MEDNSQSQTSIPQFFNLLNNANINNSILIGTNQMIQGNLDNYPNLQNIISINFGACVGFFCYSDKKFLFVHSDPSSLNHALSNIKNFYQYNDNKPFNALCFFSEGIRDSNRTKNSLEKIGKILNNKGFCDKNSFKIISLNSRNNNRSFFDLFIGVSEIRENKSPE